jgi:DNA-binding NtrC family response regulator/anti-sigma regulatory factor (Ser/Thr protein kinase)
MVTLAGHTIAGCRQREKASATPGKNTVFRAQESAGWMLRHPDRSECQPGGNPMSDVLVALGNPRLRKELAKPLNDLSYEVAETSSFFEARRRLRSGGFKLLFTEARLEDGDGRRLARRRGLRAMLVTSPDAEGENGSVPEGFIACVAPPFDANRIRDLLSARSREAPGRAAEGDSGVQLLGESEAMQDVVARLNCMAPSNAPVLITGETGTGKEVAARKLHELSRRSGGAFVAVNCGAISPSLMESQLFGHERGSFTGATRRHRGVFERADRGTLFLDEVTEMPAELQVKLLRALEGGEFHRTGGEEPVRVDVRILAATNRDVEEAVSEGRLRKDLYYRLKVLHLFLPPLRERGDDIALLACQVVPDTILEEPARELVIPNEPERISEVRRFTGEFLADIRAPVDVSQEIQLAVGEAAANAARYGRRPDGSASEVRIHCLYERPQLTVTVADEGRGFEAREVDAHGLPDVFASGGRGLFLMHQMMDEVDVSSSEEGTIVTLRRLIPEPTEVPAAG